MTGRRDVLERIASALERIAPPVSTPADWLAHPAYIWSGNGVQMLDALHALPTSQLRGIDVQKQAVLENLARLAAGAASHDILLWGARGMGKSALVRSAIAKLQANDHAMALVQVTDPDHAELPKLIEQLGQESRAFVIFLDDLGFGEGELHKNLGLRSLLEGSALARPANVRLAVTSNRRAIVSRGSGNGDPLHERDDRDNALALADRFGLRLAFHPCDQATYLEIVRAYTDPLGLTIDEEEANAWAIERGGRSGRVAHQFACEIAGRAGLPLSSS